MPYSVVQILLAPISASPKMGRCTRRKKFLGLPTSPVHHLAKEPQTVKSCIYLGVSSMPNATHFPALLLRFGKRMQLVTTGIRAHRAEISSILTFSISVRCAPRSMGHICSALSCLTGTTCLVVTGPHTFTLRCATQNTGFLRQKCTLPETRKTVSANVIVSSKVGSSKLNHASLFQKSHHLTTNIYASIWKRTRSVVITTLPS